MESSVNLDAKDDAKFSSQDLVAKINIQRINFYVRSIQIGKNESYRLTDRMKSIQELHRFQIQMIKFTHNILSTLVKRTISSTLTPLSFVSTLHSLPFNLRC